MIAIIIRSPALTYLVDHSHARPMPRPAIARCWSEVSVSVSEAKTTVRLNQECLSRPEERDLRMQRHASTRGTYLFYAGLLFPMGIAWRLRHGAVQHMYEQVDADIDVSVHGCCFYSCNHLSVTRLTQLHQLLSIFISIHDPYPPA